MYIEIFFVLFYEPTENIPIQFIYIKPEGNQTSLSLLWFTVFLKVIVFIQVF